MPSKSKDFLERLHESEAMVEYLTRLRILNPAAKLLSNPTEPRREGGFVRLAHAREEFSAPVLSKGKAAERKRREAKRRKSARHRRSLVNKTR